MKDCDCNYQIIQGDVKCHKELLQRADVIVMHNVFECFVPPHELESMWKFIMCTCTKKGSKIVTIPAISKSFQNAKVKLKLNRRKQKQQILKLWTLVLVEIGYLIMGERDSVSSASWCRRTFQWGTTWSY